MQTVLKRMWLCALIVAMGWPVAAGEPLKARVTLRLETGRSDVVIQAFIEPNALNRSVAFVLDSGMFYTSSAAELDGERAPRVKEVVFRNLPGGSYEVSVALFGAGGERGRVVSEIELW